MRSHQYRSHLVWDGDRGRDYRVRVDGKLELHGSANPAFRGDASKHDPEDLFLAAIASCHMLSYLALCARGGIRVVAYEDDAGGTLVLDGKGGGRFEEVTLRPRVTVAEEDAARALELHHAAHEQCFIANSCSVPIRVEPRS